MPLDDWNLTIGVIVAPFGLAGEVKVRLETDFPDRFAHLKQVCLRQPEGQVGLFTVEGARPHKGQILLKLREIPSIDQAEKLRNTLVQIRKQDAMRLPANEFYIYDLIDCEVVTESGRLLGRLVSVMRGGANDVYVLGQGKDEILLPVVKDVVRHVDLARRRILVTPTPGLLPEEDKTEEDKTEVHETTVGENPEESAEAEENSRDKLKSSKKNSGKSKLEK